MYRHGLPVGETGSRRSLFLLRRGGLARPPVLGLAAGAATSTVVATAASVAAKQAASATAEAGEQQDQDEPFAAVATAEQASAASTSASIAATIAETATAGQQQENPDPVAAATSTSVVLVAYASTRVVAATIRSSQITHFICLQGFIYALFYAGWPVNVSRCQEEKLTRRNSCMGHLAYSVSGGRKQDLVPGFPTYRHKSLCWRVYGTCAVKILQFGEYMPYLSLHKLKYEVK